MSTQGFQNFASNQLNELTSLRVAMNKATSAAEVNRIRAEMVEIVESLREDGLYWATKDLRPEMTGTYKGLMQFQTGATPAMPKRFSERGTREINRAKKSIENMHRDLLNWTDAVTSDTIQGGQLRAINAQIKKVNDRLEFADFRDNKERLELENQLKKLKSDQTTTKNKIGKRSGFATDEPSVIYRQRRGKGARSEGKAGLDVRDANDHMQTITQTYPQRMKAYGTFAAAEKLGRPVIVSDGRDCGWRSHRDTEKANGKVVTVDEALAHPSAHPRCQRRFTIANGPKGSKKTRDQMQEMGFVKPASKAAKAAKVAGAGAAGARAAQNVGENPVIRRTVRDIVEDKDIDLHPKVQQALNAWTGAYQKREAAAMAVKNLDETPSQFRTRIAADLDASFATDEFLSATRSSQWQVAPEQARALGLKTQATKRQIIGAIDDYGNWITHQRAIGQNLYENVRDLQIASDVQEQVFGQAAIRVQINRHHSQRLVNQWRRAWELLQGEISKDPTRATTEAIRTAASVLEPLPWARANLGGDWRFMVGMSSEGRQDLAEFIWERMRNQNAYNATELAWAKRIGLDLAQRSITPEDIAKGMIPRLSYLGKPLSTTISLENGKIVPVARLYPGQASMRWLSVQARMRAKTFTEFGQSSKEFMDNLRGVYYSQMSGIDRKRALQELLGQADDDLILSVDAFRNGPLRASMRYAGTRFESFAFKVRPAENWLRANFRVQRTTMRVKLRTPVKNAKGKYVEYVDVPVLKPSYDAVVLPNRAGYVKAGGDLLNEYGDMDITNLVANVYLWRGNIAEVSKLTGLSWDSVATMLKDNTTQYFKLLARELGVAERRVGDLLGLLRKYDINLEDLRDLEDLDQRLTAVRQAMQPSRQAAVTRRIARENVHPRLVDNPLQGAQLSDMFIQDVNDFYHTWDTLTTTIAAPEIVVKNNLTSAWAVYDKASGQVWISERAAQTWGLHGDLRAKAVRTNWFPSHTNSPIATIWHEAAHHITENLTERELREVFTEVIGSYATWAKPLDLSSTNNNLVRGEFRKRATAWMADPDVIKNITDRVGAHATGSISEFLADAFSEYMVAPQHAVRPLAKGVGTWMIKRMGKALLRGVAGSIGS